MQLPAQIMPRRRFRGFWEPSGHFWNTSGTFLGSSWPHMGRSWRFLRRLWCPLGCLLAGLGRLLGASWLSGPPTHGFEVFFRRSRKGFVTLRRQVWALVDRHRAFICARNPDMLSPSLFFLPQVQRSVRSTWIFLLKIKSKRK